MTTAYFLILALLTLTWFLVGRQRASSLAGTDPSALHSLPSYHGLFLAALVFLPMLLIFAVGAPLAERYVEATALKGFDPATVSEGLGRSAILRDIQSVLAGNYSGTAAPELTAGASAYAQASNFAHWSLLIAGVVAALLAAISGFRLIGPEFRARNSVERLVKYVLLACSAIAVLTTVGIVFSVLFETIHFFSKVSPIDFLFGLQWSPQTAIRADQVGSSGAFGIVPLVTGTLLITVIAIAVAGPLGLFAAIYMAEYASPRVRGITKPILEILAGVPTVVLGFFAALTVAPFIRGWGEMVGLNVASESALAAGLVMGMMIIPFVSSLSDDVINAVPQALRDGSYAMGATKSETIKKVVLPAALPGIVSAFMLAISRAVGETMIVVMAAGLAANLTFNPLEAVTTFTVQIKTILVGDQEFDSAKTLSAFALGFVLFFFTLVLNFIALQIVKRYREQYD
ncbi:phosphate ABC transporter permease subunit PstC [Phyllobacterium sp. A18/5-2]|uniref:phosphate ABC transporter permease subunit PstC n=1 Tax=Phyllobacterium sp. A18/5-2 TaxID=2978392 RepID=UPI0021CA8B7E|nr:phosphate ABC transporter permease subunit PstC [Phyllobacterium sp. A18/5-2]UXN64250.1 phosphate ABC transporter permease subunit PstC [Phyllobacterium sp. A18/5-2]